MIHGIFFTLIGLHMIITSNIAAYPVLKAGDKVTINIKTGYIYNMPKRKNKLLKYTGLAVTGFGIYMIDKELK